MAFRMMSHEMGAELSSLVRRVWAANEAALHRGPEREPTAAGSGTAVTDETPWSVSW
jgi:hypothetical protein